MGRLPWRDAPRVWLVLASIMMAVCDRDAAAQVVNVTLNASALNVTTVFANVTSISNMTTPNTTGLPYWELVNATRRTRTPSRSPSVTPSLPFAGGVVRWLVVVVHSYSPSATPREAWLPPGAEVVKMQDVSEEPGSLPVAAAGGRSYSPSLARIGEGDLVRYNVTFIARLAHDEWAARFVAQPSLMFRLLNVTFPGSRVTQSRGITGRFARGLMLNRDSLWLNFTHLAVTLFGDPLYLEEAQADVAFNFARGFNLTYSTRPVINPLRITIVVASLPLSPAVVAPLGLINFAALAGLAAIGAPGLHQVQAVSLIGSMTCASRPVQALTSKMEYFTAPLPLADLPVGRFGANILLPLYVALLHTVALYAIGASVPRMSTEEAMARTGFPALPFVVLIASFPGFVTWGVRSSYQVIDGGTTVTLWCAAAVNGGYIIVMLMTLRTAKSFLARRMQFTNLFGAQQESGASDETAAALRGCLYAVPRLFFTPTGVWAPREVMQMYYPILWPYNGRWRGQSYIPFAESLGIAVITGYQPATSGECRVQFAALGAWMLATLAFYIVRPPFRYRVWTLLACLIQVSLLVMAAGTAVVPDSDAPVTATYFIVSSSLVISLAAIQLAVSVGLWVKEKRDEERAAAAVVGPAHQPPLPLDSHMSQSSAQPGTSVGRTARGRRDSPPLDAVSVHSNDTL